jgi:hypothetical protein
MGFEVLDVGAPASTPTRSTPGDVRSAVEPDVLDLDGLPEPAEPDGYRPRRLGVPSWLRGRTVRGPSALAALLAVLLVGVVSGAAWAGHRHEQQRTAERAATLAVTALADSWTRVPWTRRPVVDVVVRLVNTGPLPVDVVGSNLGDRPRTGRPYVRPLTDGLRVNRGGELAISVLQRIDCSSTTPLSIEVPVRTADGTVHPVTVLRGGPERLVPQQVCDEATEDLGVTVTLQGSLDHPVAEIRNPTSTQIVLATDSLLPLSQARPVSVSTTPRLPVAVAPNASRRLALSIRTWSCIKDGARLQAAGRLSLLAWVVPASSGGSTVDTSFGRRQPLELDVSALVGAAAQRACS